MADRLLEKQLVKLTEYMNSHYFGKYIGKVQNIGDDKNFGYITAVVPEIYGEIESPWAKPCVPFAGSSFGFLMLPNKGDLVWIEFEAGDISRPIWSGFLWSDSEVPESAEGKKRIILTPGGNQIIFDDENEELKLISNESTVTITSDSVEINAGRLITVTSSSIEIDGGSKITINSSGVEVT
ncbi:MAG: phage baseplate assembly protein V [Candidatus Thorarchaeota archaeon]